MHTPAPCVCIRAFEVALWYRRIWWHSHSRWITMEVCTEHPLTAPLVAAVVFRTGDFSSAGSTLRSVILRPCLTWWLKKICILKYGDQRLYHEIRRIRLGFGKRQISGNIVPAISFNFTDHVASSSSIFKSANLKVTLIINVIFLGREIKFQHHHSKLHAKKILWLRFARDNGSYLPSLLIFFRARRWKRWILAKDVAYTAYIHTYTKKEKKKKIVWRTVAYSAFIVRTPRPSSLYCRRSRVICRFTLIHRDLFYYILTFFNVPWHGCGHAIYTL